MNPFTYQRVSDATGAIAAVAGDEHAAFLAGGTNLVDLMKLHVMTPSRLVDVNAVPLAKIEAGRDGLRIGALARMSDVAADPDVAREFPVIAEALLASASPQLRNMATIGGNLMQRTRCPYFRGDDWACNKRMPGSGCAAAQGEHRNHAILGASDHCFATHPSDLAVALVALDAVVRVRGPAGERSIPLRDFHILPGATPHVECALQQGELITGVDVPASDVAINSRYVKVRDRASYEFALVSAAVALKVEGGVIADCRIALGGVGTKPWRTPEAEQVSRGRPAAASTYEAAASIAVAEARPREQNAFKVELARRVVVHALTTLGSTR
ncbi:MAG: xanthine dehydrogenase family protein subunit M [Paludisphaera borealis]|uniref:FAD binding domain-containing protein n=1 Tax=Paludisphaera borealis TaxID=1387353 RepID=UPI00284DB8F0|nr:xanthine dehydrogenase family protein subunit M [Paludisphaera borealis]MDR3618243.1 xanthine dehydrogenase family protein subunit M [Paludisphaera borealis]